MSWPQFGTAVGIGVGIGIEFSSHRTQWTAKRHFNPFDTDPDTDTSERLPDFPFKLLKE